MELETSAVPNEIENTCHPGVRRTGVVKVGWIFTFPAAAYNLVRMRKMIPISAAA
jgi:hypothetical protein